jgi:hypothetical protein
VAQPGQLGGSLLVDGQQFRRPASPPDGIRVAAHVIEVVRAGHEAEFRPLDGQTPGGLHRDWPGRGVPELLRRDVLMANQPM